MDPVVLIPAYRPDDRLWALVKDLRALDGGLRILVVNDGSGTGYAPLFDRLGADYGCQVLSHTSNLGKGAAIKTGMAHLLHTRPRPSGCVTADADLQHSPTDILRVADALSRSDGQLVLGTRDFAGDGVPLRSKWGNRITAWVFRLGTGVSCTDTQTGLRGIPLEWFPAFLAVRGNRFEYEMNLLMEAARMKIPFRTVSIQTIYHPDRHTSHFRTFSDSLRITAGILRYGAASLLCALLDLAAFQLLAATLFSAAPGRALLSTVTARCLSGVCNFALNRKWVFASRGKPSGEAAKYLALFFAQMLLSGGLVTLFAMMGAPLLPVKIAVDGGLFFMSYHIQKRCVFVAGPERTGRK